MINVAVYGVNSASTFLYKLITEVYNRYIELCGGEQLQVACFVNFMGTFSESTSELDTITVSCEEFSRLYKMNAVEAIMIPTINHSGFHFLGTELIKLGVRLEDIYYVPREYFLKDSFTLPEAENMFTPYLDCGYLPYLEYHVADHCNLNCRGCEHYSPLVKEPRFTDYEKFAKDLNKLSEFITDIGVIRILGGEPLLNNELHKYVTLTRKLYPYSCITIVTNGILIKQMASELIDAIKENDIFVHISWYPPLRNSQESILDFLDFNEIKYTKNMAFTEEFTMKQSLKGDTDKESVFLSCFQAHCNNLYDGKLGACFFPFVTKYFNDTFNQCLPINENISLYDENLTTNKIKSFLLTPLERCKYCGESKNIKWEQASVNPTLSDWIL